MKIKRTDKFEELWNKIPFRIGALGDSQVALFLVSKGVSCYFAGDFLLGLVVIVSAILWVVICFRRYEMMGDVCKSEK